MSPAWLVVPWHAAVAGLAVWWLWCRLWVRRVDRRADLDLDLRLAWRIWHWFSGQPFVPWSPDRDRRSGRWWPKDWTLWTLESGRSLPCVDMPDVELVDLGESAAVEIDPGDAAQTRPWWGCRQRRIAVGVARTLGTVGVVAAEYVRAGAPFGARPAQIALCGFAGTVVLSGTPLAIGFRAVRRAIFRHWEEPLAEAVRKRAGWSRPLSEGRVPVRRICRVYRDDQFGLRIWIAVDPSFESGDEASKTANRNQLWNDVAVRGGIDVGQIEPDWSGLEGRRPSVTFRQRDLVPHRVLFNIGSRLVKQTIEILEHEGSIEAPVIGIGAGWKPYCKKLATESPHLAISVGTGGGKSVFLKLIAAQMLWHGADLYILDYKRASHRWVNGPHGLINGVRAYCRNLPDIHIQAIELGRIAMERYEQCDALGADDDLPDFQPIVIAMDEIPMTLTMLRSWWQAQGNSGVCPSVVALESILMMGRAVRIHVIGAWQRFEARHMPGGAAGRENFGVKVAVGANRDTFDLTFKGAEFIPPNNRPGWAIAGHGFVVTEIQRILADDDRNGNMAVYRWVGARRGYCQHRGSAPRPEVTTTPLAEAELAVNDPEPPELVDDPDPRRVVITFRQAVEEGTCEYRLWDTATRARRRARQNGTWPDPAPGHEGVGDNREGEGHYRGVLADWFHGLPGQKGWADDPDPLVYFMAKGGRAEVEAALRGDKGDGTVVKVGYSAQYLPDRIRPMAGFDIDDVFAVVRVPGTKRGEQHADKWWHKRFELELVPPKDPKAEFIRITPGGHFARYLGRLIDGDEVVGPHGPVRGEQWQPREMAA